MTNYIYNTFILLLLSALVGCSTDENEIYTGTGRINVTVSVDTDIISTRSADVYGNSPSPADMSIHLTSADGKYTYAWPSLGDMPSDEEYAVGEYRLEASYGSIDKEGFDVPYYYGSTTFTVLNGTAVPVGLECRLTNVMLSLSFSDSFKARYSDYSAILHSIGHGYVNYSKSETRPIYLHPGDIDLSISLTTMSGTVTNFHPTTLKNALARHHYNILFDIQTADDGIPLLVLDVDDELVSDDVVFRLDDTLLMSPMPEVSTEGFTDGVPYYQDEGTSASDPLRFVVDAPGGIQSIMLTSLAPELTSQGWPQEIDIVSDAEGEGIMSEKFGLKYELASDREKAYIDFTEVLSHMTYSSEVDESVFTVVVIDKLKKVNDPVRLRIVNNPVPVEIDDIGQPLICDTEANMVVTCSNPTIVNNLKVQLQNGGNWSQPVLVQCIPQDISFGKYLLTFPIDMGGRDIPFMLSYNDKLKASGTIYRKSPPYSIAVDAFAMGAIIKIDTEERYRGYITENLTIYVDNVSTPVLWRDVDGGFAAIGSLISGHGYYITSSAMADNDNPTFSNTVPIVTETTTPLTNGDFEDAKSVIDNYSLLSGGRYSASIAPIFNQQNVCNVNVSLPSSGNWSTVNDKTFCTSAGNQNTWYMQPSAMITNDCQNGSKAMKLVSVGWDLSGEDIDDYVQESIPYTIYSRSIPTVSHVAAGRLFLGNYKFDPSSCSETYDYGIAFTSRPSALNGYFKYMPGEQSPQERGLATVEVIGLDNGREITIAKSTLRFPPTTDYTAFSIPIEYNHFGVKAAKIRILFASTDQIGTIEEESQRIHPYYNPQAAAAVGASLYIDNVSLSY